MELYLHITQNYTFTDHDSPHGKWWHRIVHFCVNTITQQNILDKTLVFFGNFNLSHGHNFLPGAMPP